MCVQDSGGGGDEEYDSAVEGDCGGLRGVGGLVVMSVRCGWMDRGAVID